MYAVTKKVEIKHILSFCSMLNMQGSIMKCLGCDKAGLLYIYKMHAQGLGPRGLSSTLRTKPMALALALTSSCFGFDVVG